jgi:hypothetical protein
VLNADRYAVPLSCEQSGLDEKQQGDGSMPNVTPNLEGIPRRQGPLPVWFFVGIIFVVYGGIILVTGLLEISHPVHTVLYQVHPAIWWGAVILAVGLFFTTRHRRRE